MSARSWPEVSRACSDFPVSSTTATMVTPGITPYRSMIVHSIAFARRLKRLGYRGPSVRDAIHIYGGKQGESRRHHV